MHLLSEQRGQDLLLDGSGVQRLGGQCLQVLLAACSTWTADSRVFSIVEPSPELLAALSLLGVGADSPMLQQEQRS